MDVTIQIPDDIATGLVSPGASQDARRDVATLELLVPICVSQSTYV